MRRAGAALLLLVLELGCVSLLYDAGNLGRQPGLTALLASHAALGLQFGFSALAALSLVLGARLAPIREALAGAPTPAMAPGAAWHALALLVFLALCQQLFGAAQATQAPSPWLLLAWLICGVGVIASLALLAAPRCFWRALWAQERGRITGALLAGAALCGAGLLARGLWLPLSDWTLQGAHAVLALAYPEASIRPGLILGTARFAVQIAPQCSGCEGVGLMLVFVSLYLWAFRATLRFPLALALLPVGVAGVLGANVLRIAALVMVGTAISPALAEQGFHSQAGWIGFCTVALGLILLAHRFLRRPDAALADAAESGGAAVTLASALLLPLLLEVAGGMLAAATRVDGFTLLAPLPGILAGCALWRFRNTYRAHAWLRIGLPDPLALPLGAVVFLFWQLLAPADPGPAPVALQALPDGACLVWLVLRLASSVLLIPLAEELAFRGYLLHKLTAADFAAVPPGTLRPLAVLVSSLLFGLLHEAWLPGALSGIAFAFALGRRGRLIDAVAAHATANLLLAAAVLGWGRWALWS